MLAVPIWTQATPAGNSPARAVQADDNLFEYVITSPAPGAEKFRTINLQFPNAASIEYIPSFFDRPDYLGYKINGQKYNCSEFPTFGDADNEVSFSLGAEVSASDRWELTIQPGLFRLLDADENTLGENPLMEIVITEGHAASKVDFSYTTAPVSNDPYDESMKISELSEIKLTFPNLDTVKADGEAATLTLGETTVDKGAYTLKADGTDNIVRITFDPVLTTETDAALTITFPVGSLTGKKGNVSDSNQADVVCRYYEMVPATKYDLSFDFYKPKPDAEGNLSVKESLSMAMFICDTPNIKVGGGSTPHITLRQVDGNFVSSGRLTTINGMVSGKSTFYASFDQPVYNGEYTITLSKSAIGDDLWRADHTMGHSNDEVVLRFNIVDGKEPAEAPHIDLTVAYTGTEAVAVKGVPSEDNIYWYCNIIEANRYPGDDEIFDAAIDFFKLGADTFGMDWVTIYQMTAKTGEFTWGFDGLFSSSDYIVYAFGLDNKGKLYMPVTKINVRTADQDVSDNKFTLDVVSVENGTAPESKKVTFSVTPTNDDQYTVVILDKYICDGYDLNDPISVKNLMHNVLRPLVSSDRLYKGKQTIVFDNVKIDAVMQGAVFGYETTETTDPTMADFSTVDDNFEAITVQTYNPTISGASATIYSFDMVRPFISGVISKETAEAIGGIENVHENYRIPSWTAEGMDYYDWRYFANRDLCRQPLDGTLAEILHTSSLKWNTEYYVYGYLMDEGGYRTSPVYFDSFTTAPCNVGNNKFELTLDEIISNEPYSSETFTANMTVTPEDKEADYAIYYGDTYGFEEYLAEDRVDDWMYDVFMSRKVKRTYTDVLSFGYGSVYPDKNYILVVTGFDEAPNTKPTWMIFNKDGVVSRSSGLQNVSDAALRVSVIDRDIRLDGEFTEATVYTLDGIRAGKFNGNVCRVAASGCYIVSAQTADGVVTRKVVVK